MSRLDSFIRRLEAQRACLNAGAALVAGRPGVVFELGLGNGRTYDHLRWLMEGREIFVFERVAVAHPDCMPDPAHLFEGALEDTLKRAATRFAGNVILVHADLGSGRAREDAELMGFVAGALGPVLAAQGVVVCDQELPGSDWNPLPLPESVSRGRYHLYRKGVAERNP